MRLWPFRRRETAAAHEEIDAALWEADRALLDAKNQRCRAEDVTNRLSETRERNHIAESIRRIMRGQTT